MPYPDNFTSLHPESPEYRERKLDADEAWDEQRAARNECDYLSDELAALVLNSTASDADTAEWQALAVTLQAALMAAKQMLRVS